MVVVAVPLFWHAPKLKAPAKTARIISAFKSFILFLTPFVAGCWGVSKVANNAAQCLFANRDFLCQFQLRCRRTNKRSSAGRPSSPGDGAVGSRAYQRGFANVSLFAVRKTSAAKDLLSFQ